MNWKYASESGRQLNSMLERLEGMNFERIRFALSNAFGFDPQMAFGVPFGGS
jgi:hypothetical protein